MTSWQFKALFFASLYGTMIPQNNGTNAIHTQVPFYWKTLANPKNDTFSLVLAIVCSYVSGLKFFFKSILNPIRPQTYHANLLQYVTPKVVWTFPSRFWDISSSLKLLCDCVSSADERCNMYGTFLNKNKTGYHTHLFFYLN